MKDKCIAIIQKQVIMKTIIWSLESYKTLTQIWKDSWNGFGDTQHESDSQIHVRFQSLLSFLMDVARHT